MKLNRNGLKIIDRFGNKKCLLPPDKAAKIVEYFVKVKLNDNQFSALVSFVCDRGSTAFRRSSILRLVNQSEDDKNKLFQVAKHLQSRQWDVHRGRKLKNLSERRKAEAELFLTPVIVVNQQRE